MPDNGLLVLGYHANPDQTIFLRYILPMYNYARVEKRIDAFMDKMFPVWLDRFPVVILNKAGLVDPLATKLALPRHKAARYRKLMWLSWESEMWCLDLEWEDKMTIEADRAQRRRVYHALAKCWKKDWPRGHQWEVAVPAEERARIEIDPEDFLQAWADRMLKELAQPDWGTR
ncbi:hypothetical protein Hypma_013857 [Hypsizygus marmoreus]|uniref:Uncharacterized protein n=1 Tax=Hypsizygus marmoreus TaxID=39966 RepID=A0A369K7A3_HYPMA|nr:hypothetical protein Hypma_013857 [Hypsizygus marmoreus]